MDKKALTECKNVLRSLRIPIDLFDTVIVPIKAVINALDEIIQENDTGNTGGKGEKPNADGSIQRKDADSAKPDAGR